MLASLSDIETVSSGRLSSQTIVNLLIPIHSNDTSFDYTSLN